MVRLILQAVCVNVWRLCIVDKFLNGWSWFLVSELPHRTATLCGPDPPTEGRPPWRWDVSLLCRGWPSQELMSSCSGLSGPCSYVRYLTGGLHFFICLSCQDQRFWTIILQSDGPCYSQLTVQKQWRHLFVSALIFSMYECDASAFSFIPYRIDTDRIQDSGETGAVTSATTSARFTQLQPVPIGV